MTKEKRILYNKAYVELYELIKLLSDEERSKIPNQFIKYICDNMDRNYTFIIDNKKGLFEQNYMVETQALIVKLYEKYFALESEKEFWNKYHVVCFKMIEEEKCKKYNKDIFNNKETNEKLIKEEAQLIEYKEKEWYKKIVDKIKRIFKNK